MYNFLPPTLYFIPTHPQADWMPPCLLKSMNISWTPYTFLVILTQGNRKCRTNSDKNVQEGEQFLSKNSY